MSGTFRCKEYSRGKSNCCFPALPLRHKVSLSGEKVSKWTKLDKVSRSLEKFSRILAKLQRKESESCWKFSEQDKEVWSDFKSSDKTKIFFSWLDMCTLNNKYIYVHCTMYIHLQEDVRQSYWLIGSRHIMLNIVIVCGYWSLMQMEIALADAAAANLRAARVQSLTYYHLPQICCKCAPPYPWPLLLLLLLLFPAERVQQKIRGNISGESHDAAHCYAQWTLPMMLPIAMIAHDAAGQWTNMQIRQI